MRYSASSPLMILRWRWALTTVLYGIALFCGYLSLRQIWSHAMDWLVIAALVSAYLLYVVWKLLPKNHRKAESGLLIRLGLGNALTLVRGLAIAFIAGFLGSPWPMGPLAWLPLGLAIFYFVADCFDGYLARLTNHTTVMGEQLDLEFDKVGVFIGVTLAIWYGQLPLWYLLLGLGGHIFSFTFWLRSKLQLPIHDLPPSIYRRLFAGIQMWTIATMFWPTLTPTIATFTGVLTGGFAGAIFITDWLIVCGYLNPQLPHYKTLIRLIQIVLNQWLPLALRLALLISLIMIMNNFSNPFQPNEWVELYRHWGFPAPELMALLAGVICITGLLSIALGMLGRIWVILMVCPIYFEAIRAGFEVTDAVALGSCILLIAFGLGRFTLWQPDETAMNRYIHR